MKILNCYAGLGGNRKLWTPNGDEHEITAVELEPQIAKVYQDNFPNDTVIVGDAHQYILDHSDEFDFIWTSPPCQTRSRMAKATRHKLRRYTDMSLYQEVIYLKHFFKGKYVAENVKPFFTSLIPPDKIIGRHIFYANFEIDDFHLPNHKNFIAGTNTVAQAQKLKEWLGFNYEGNLYYKDNHCPGQVLRNCVHPETGLHILNCAMNKINQPKQIGLFQ